MRSRANAPVKPSLQPSCLWPWRCSSQGTPLRYATNVSQQSRGYAVGDESVKEPTAISVERYHEVADAYLEGVQQSLEELSEADESVDVEFSVSQQHIRGPRHRPDEWWCSLGGSSDGCDTFRGNVCDQQTAAEQADMAEFAGVGSEAV